MPSTVLASCAVDRPDCVDTASIDLTLPVVGIVVVVLVLVAVGVAMLGRSSGRR